VRDLSLDQVALLVALVRGPSEYDPRRYANRALQRRNLILTEMQTQNLISPVQAAEAQAAPLGVIPSTHRSNNRYPAFLDAVRRQLRQDYREEDLTSEGLRIFTTFDTQLQEILEKTVSSQLKKLEKQTRARKLETAVIVTHRDNGEIAAMVGGRESLAGGFNRALDALRPIGSLVKPAIYLTALQNPDKYSITSKVDDSFIVVKSKDGGEDWIPKNYDHKEHGRIPLHTALAKSYNLATVHIGMDVGITSVANTLKNMGVTRPVALFPSLLLGASALAPMDVTAMYQTLAGDGFTTPIKGIRAVLAADGKALQSYPFNVKQAVDPAATYIVNTILQEVMHKGTGADAYKSFSKDYGLVGKTGTTNDAKDSWFAGYTGDYLAVVWVGRDDNKPIGLTGAQGALPVWVNLMQQISQQPVQLNPPDNIKMLWVDAYSGLLTRNGCGTGVQYPYIEGFEPTSYASCGNKANASEEKPESSWFDDDEQPESAPVIDAPVE
jgi:penicillin-binding protein 1B